MDTDNLLRGACLDRSFDCHGDSIAEIDPTWVYVDSEHTWEPTADEIEASRGRRGVEIVIFTPDGEFERFIGVLASGDSPERVSIERPEAATLARGTWVRDGEDLLSVRYARFDSGDAGVERAPAMHFEEHWIVQGAVPGRLGASLASPTREYVPIATRTV